MWNKSNFTIRYKWTVFRSHWQFFFLSRFEYIFSRSGGLGGRCVCKCSGKKCRRKCWLILWCARASIWKSFKSTCDGRLLCMRTSLCVCVCVLYIYLAISHILVISFNCYLFTKWFLRRCKTENHMDFLQHSVELSNAQHNNHRNKRALSFVVVAAVLFSLSSFYACIDLFLIFQQFFGVQGIASWGWCALVCSMPIVVCECVWMIQDAKICAA